MLPNTCVLDLNLFFFSEQMCIFFSLKALKDRGLSIPPLRKMTKNCNNTHVSETIDGKKPTSPSTGTFCVFYSGDALAVPLQFLHAAIIS